MSTIRPPSAAMCIIERSPLAPRRPCKQSVRIRIHQPNVVQNNGRTKHTSCQVVAEELISAHDVECVLERLYSRHFIKATNSHRSKLLTRIRSSSCIEPVRCHQRRRRELIACCLYCGDLVTMENIRRIPNREWLIGIQIVTTHAVVCRSIQDSILLVKVVDFSGCWPTVGRGRNDLSPRCWKRRSRTVPSLVME